MPDDVGFLAERASICWEPKAQRAFGPYRVFTGCGELAIEVVVATSDAVPNRTDLQNIWRKRRAGRATPVLLAVLYPDGAAICGPTGEQPRTDTGLNPRQVEGLCREVLSQPDRHAALRFLLQALPSLHTAIPGFRNEGLIALHELQHGTRDPSDWTNAMGRAGAAAGKRGQQLIEALGFRLERIDNLTHLLRSGDRRTALAVMLQESESHEAGTDRFNGLSPVSYALATADNEDLKWVVMVQGSRIRLYSTKADTGVGRRGRTETYIECQPSLLSDDHLPFLWLLFSADALVSGGSLHDIIAESHRFAGDLALRLRERIYDDVVPTLAKGIAEARKLEDPNPAELEKTYEMALTVLFRLLFIAYAEDRDLLPYQFNEAYRRRSLKQKAQELAKCVRDGVEIAQGGSHWTEVALLWQAVAIGNWEWGIPAYGGGLFSNDPQISPSGAELAKVDLPNWCFERALRALLVIDTAENVPGPVDFRSLGVSEFGTIYEGLLESELALAPSNLVLTKLDVYVPAKPHQPVAVFQGEVYLHSRSGVRKSSGSYYTKPFAVEHLLNNALEPALLQHFSRLDDMDDTEAAEAFFDFRVADIAMGSGHFLVAAIDRIETGMAGFLAKRDLSGVRTELALLRSSAQEALGEHADPASIESGQLLRRMIARRCIYGVDLNALSVQLARLAVWIHTFVPGLPLSLLDYTLVHGNALVGIGTTDDITKALGGKAAPLLKIDADSLLGHAKNHLRRLANINDATLHGIDAERKARDEVAAAIDSARSLCDVITVSAMSKEIGIEEFVSDYWENRKSNSDRQRMQRDARTKVAALNGLHFPVAFPEVFLRDRPGFDVILGNPPWQEATIEEHAFWARHFPGFRGLSAREREAEQARLRAERPDLVENFKTERTEMENVRKALVSGGYPGMGTGDPDLYKAFCWRFWHLCASEHGRIGVVLPRSALAAKGSTEFRTTVFANAAKIDIVMLKNRLSWVFDDVTPQYTIGLVSLARGSPDGKSICLRGPFFSRPSFDQGVNRSAAEFDCAEVLAWNDTASLPLLPDPHSVDVFAQIRNAPRLDMNKPGTGGGWRARPDREMDATQQKALMVFGRPDHNGGPGRIRNFTPRSRKSS